jgi:D-glycero-alpha-D-manno-heptose 1-phosphate guanylyltransferase
MPSLPDVIILCGGAGTRLRTIAGDAPKGMAHVAGRPFLELLLEQLKRQGFTRVILAVGFKSDFIRSHFGENFPDLELIYSTEHQALGTAGAIRNAAHLVKSGSVLIMNGDSYTDVNLADFVHGYDGSKSDGSLVVVSADDRTDCGFVVLDADKMVVAFNEKHVSANAGLVNAGVYVLSSRILSDIPSGREVSLENEMFPAWLGEGKKIRAFVHSGACVDIGTPDRYRSAQSLLAAVEVNPSSVRA